MNTYILGFWVQLITWNTTIVHEEHTNIPYLDQQSRVYECQIKAWQICPLEHWKSDQFYLFHRGHMHGLNGLRRWLRVQSRFSSSGFLGEETYFFWNYFYILPRYIYLHITFQNMYYSTFFRFLITLWRGRRKKVGGEVGKDIQFYT